MLIPPQNQNNTPGIDPDAHAGVTNLSSLAGKTDAQTMSPDEQSGIANLPSLANQTDTQTDTMTDTQTDTQTVGSDEEGGINDLLNIVENTQVAEDGEDDTIDEEVNEDPLRDGVKEQLRKLLVEREPSVANGLTMRFALLLIIQAFRDLKEEMETEKDTFLSRITTTIVDKRDDDTLRFWVGNVIADALAHAPWGFPSATPSTVNSIFAAICAFARTLNIELAKKQGVNLDEFELHEEDDEDEDGEDIEGEETVAAAIKKQRNRRNPNARDKRGNYGHGKARIWTPEELLSLFKSWRDVQGNQEEKVADHNATFRPAGDARVRTKEACRQQMDGKVGLTPQNLSTRLGAKIAEYEAIVASRASN